MIDIWAKTFMNATRSPLYDDPSKRRNPAQIRQRWSAPDHWKARP